MAEARKVSTPSSFEPTVEEGGGGEGERSQTQDIRKQTSPEKSKVVGSRKKTEKGEDTDATHHKTKVSGEMDGQLVKDKVEESREGSKEQGAKSKTKGRGTEKDSNTQSPLRGGSGRGARKKESGTSRPRWRSGTKIVSSSSVGDLGDKQQSPHRQSSTESLTSRTVHSPHRKAAQDTHTSSKSHSQSPQHRASSGDSRTGLSSPQRKTAMSSRDPRSLALGDGKRSSSPRAKLRGSLLDMAV